MLQRIQSLYLLGTIVLQVLITQFSFLNFTKQGAEYTLSAFGIVGAQGKILVSEQKQLFIIILSCVFALAATFSFKNRKLQLKLVKFIGFICAAQLSFAAISAYRLMEDGASQLNPGICSYLILLCLVLVILTSKSIKKDEDLIKSVDRIR